GVASHLVAVGPDRGGVAADRHADAEVIEGGAVAGGQLLLLAPGRARAHEHVRRALLGVAPHLVLARPDHGGAAAARHADAEVIRGGAVAGGQLLLLAPGGARAPAPLRRALLGVAPHLVVDGPDRGGVAADRHAVAEFIEGGAVTGGELLLLAP